MGGGFDCLCWPWVGRLTDLVLPGGGYLNLSSPDEEIFDCRLGRKRLRPNIMFPTSKLLEIMEANENKRKLGGFFFKFPLF